MYIAKNIPNILHKALTMLDIYIKVNKSVWKQNVFNIFLNVFDNQFYFCFIYYKLYGNVLFC